MSNIIYSSALDHQTCLTKYKGILKSIDGNNKFGYFSETYPDTEIRYVVINPNANGDSGYVAKTEVKTQEEYDKLINFKDEE